MSQNMFVRYLEYLPNNYLLFYLFKICLIYLFNVIIWVAISNTYIYCTKFLNIFNENNKAPSVYIFVLTVETGHDYTYQWCKKDKKESVADLSNYLWRDQEITLVHITCIYFII